MERERQREREREKERMPYHKVFLIANQTESTR